MYVGEKKFSNDKTEIDFWGERGRKEGTSGRKKFIQNDRKSIKS